SVVTVFRVAQFCHRLAPPVLDVSEWSEYREVVLHLSFKTFQHAGGELAILAFLAVLRDPEAERHADDDEESLEQPMAKGSAHLRHVRVHLHCKILRFIERLRSDRAVTLSRHPRREERVRDAEHHRPYEDSNDPECHQAAEDSSK